MGALQDKKEEVMPQCLVFCNQKKGKEKLMKKIKGVGEGNVQYRRREVWTPLSPTQGYHIVS